MIEPVFITHPMLNKKSNIGPEMERAEGAPSVQELNDMFDTGSDEPVLAKAGGIHNEFLQVLDDKAIADSLGISFKGSYADDEVVEGLSPVEERLVDLGEKIEAEDTGKSTEELARDAEERDKRAERYFKNENSRLQ